jgi:hypothetical protein
LDNNLINESQTNTGTMQYDKELNIAQAELIPRAGDIQMCALMNCKTSGASDCLCKLRPLPCMPVENRVYE